MGYKFERLEVWQLAMEYLDLIYPLANRLPRSEDFNLKSQIIRAATSIQLNIAEGSTTQTDPEQARLVGMAIRSLVETVACQHQINRRKFYKTHYHCERHISSAKSCLPSCRHSAIRSVRMPGRAPAKNQNCTTLIYPAHFEIPTARYGRSTPLVSRMVGGGRRSVVGGQTWERQ